MSAYSDFMTLSAARYSCRNYAARTVARETLKKAIEAASLAPSAVNRQPWTFVVLDTPEMRQAIAECYPREWIKTAPAFIVAVGNHSEAWHRPSDGKDHTDIDLAIAIEHLCRHIAGTWHLLGVQFRCKKVCRTAPPARIGRTRGHSSHRLSGGKPYSGKET